VGGRIVALRQQAPLPDFLLAQLILLQKRPSGEARSPPVLSKLLVDASLAKGLS